MKGHWLLASVAIAKALGLEPVTDVNENPFGDSEVTAEDNIGVKTYKIYKDGQLIKTVDEDKNSTTVNDLIATIKPFYQWRQSKICLFFTGNMTFQSIDI